MKLQLTQAKPNEREFKLEPRAKTVGAKEMDEEGSVLPGNKVKKDLMLDKAYESNYKRIHMSEIRLYP